MPTPLCSLTHLRSYVNDAVVKNINKTNYEMSIFEETFFRFHYINGERDKKGLPRLVKNYD
jgi:hypothetical protein